MLDTNNWKEFRYDEIFNIEISKSLNKNDVIFTHDKGIKYISRTNKNNGCLGYVQEIHDKYINSKNKLTVVMVGELAVFYQDENFVTSQNILVMDLLGYTLNKYIAFFLITLLQKEKYKFNYGRCISKDKAEQSKIKLPVQEDGTPDYLYMENYIKEIWDKYIPKLDAKLTKEFDIFKNEFPETSHINNKQVLDTSKWKEFRYDEIFSIERGNVPLNKLSFGKIPVLSSKDNNNGIYQYYEVDNKDRHDNIISVANNGSIGSTFYHNYEVAGSSDVSFLSLRNYTLNKYIAFFLITLIKRESYRFNYGRKWGLERMCQSKIKLPVQEDGTPDYLYMENYIKEIWGEVCARIRERIK